MSRRRYRAEEIIHNLREAEVLLAHGKKTHEVCKKLGDPVWSCRDHRKHHNRRVPNNESKYGHELF